MAHGGGRRCAHIVKNVSCTKIAVSTQPFCRIHGGVRHCRECGEPTKGNQSMCKQHLENSPSSPASSTTTSTPFSTPSTGGTPSSPSPFARGASMSPLSKTHPVRGGGGGSSSLSAFEYVTLRSRSAPMGSSAGASGSGRPFSGSGSGSGTTEPAQRGSPRINWSVAPSDILPSDSQGRYNKHASTQDLHVKKEYSSRGRLIKTHTRAETSDVPRGSIELPSKRTAHVRTAEELQPTMAMDAHCVDDLMIVEGEDAKRFNSISPEHNGIIDTDTEMDALYFDH